MCGVPLGSVVPKVATNCDHDVIIVGLFTGPMLAGPTKAAVLVRHRQSV